jgi:hypothetical protein
MSLKLILAALMLFPTYKEDRAHEIEKAQQLMLIAANLRMANVSKEAAALVIALGNNETHYSLRIHRGQCASNECPGSARSPWQFEKTPVTADEWDLLTGIENTGWQVARAAWFANWALRDCGGDARCAFRLLAGLDRETRLATEDARVADYSKALQVLR